MSSASKVIIALLLAYMISLAVPARTQEKFNLKPGARGDICLECHTDIQEKLKNPFVHTPVEIRECTGCHSPHASSHGKLLAEEVNKVCYVCHDSVVPTGAISTHRVVMEGNCVKCHDPHSAKNKFNLMRAGNELCLECHENIKSILTKVKYEHKPVKAGCLNCHMPHGSATAPTLLKEKVPSLCAKCHKTEDPVFTKVHMGYPVAQANCTVCHNPHGSSRPALLYDNMHMPVANKMCNQCHEAPSSPKPFRTLRAGFELCRGCHYEMVNDALAKNNLHWPILSGKGCLNCHNPHASKQNSLLKKPTMNLCETCHADTVQRSRAATTKHPPVEEGICTFCHSPHASDSIFLLTQTPIIELCSNCHDLSKHKVHAMGEKAIDPRNKNLTVECLSCHEPHGTNHKRMARFPIDYDLCIQCHIKFKR